MSTHIDHIVTEVIAEPEPASDGEPEDKRWSEQLKVEALLKLTERYRQRLSAESFDD